MNALIKDINEKRMENALVKAASIDKTKRFGINIYQRFKKELNLDFKDLDHTEI